MPSPATDFSKTRQIKTSSPLYWTSPLTLIAQSVSQNREDDGGDLVSGVGRVQLSERARVSGGTVAFPRTRFFDREKRRFASHLRKPKMPFPPQPAQKLPRPLRVRGVDLEGQPTVKLEACVAVTHLERSGS